MYHTASHHRYLRPVRGSLCLIGLVLTLILTIPGWTQSDQVVRKSPENDQAINRGKYLVEDVAMCGQCHTPRDDQGALIRSKWLEGASLWLQPSKPTQDWPLKAPRLAGNPPGTDADLIKLLTTGAWLENKPLRPPMPQFRLSREDAEAVVAYLKSLSPEPR